MTGSFVVVFSSFSVRHHHDHAVVSLFPLRSIATTSVLSFPKERVCVLSVRWLELLSESGEVEQWTTENEAEEEEGCLYVAEEFRLSAVTRTFGIGVVCVCSVELTSPPSPPFLDRYCSVVLAGRGADGPEGDYLSRSIYLPSGPCLLLGDCDLSIFRGGVCRSKAGRKGREEEEERREQLRFIRGQWKNTMGLWETFLNWLRSLFFTQEMELSLIGLQNAGKTSLVNVIATGGYQEDMIPTVGFNMRKISKGSITIKLWDLGGQPRFRSMWERYCRGTSAIVYVVDAADRDNIPISKNELHDLLSKPSLSGIPLLVLGNKIDNPEALSKQAITDQMGLANLTDREVCCYAISCKNNTNINEVMDWLIKHSKTKS
ncbi:hypothetical protein R1flu_010454 [Riccia fluitans]|uniref:ADP-ribosylation factor-like protein 8A n=1 Tax=Riccia fluitans TaxID=41844 RepID=A0ABD1Z512_9MARC